MLILTLLFAYLTGILSAQTRVVEDPGVITTHQSITPAGLQSVFAGRVYGVAFGKTADEVWVLHADGVTLLDWHANKTIAKIPISGAAGLAGVRYDPVEDRALVSVVPRGGVAELWSVQRDPKQRTAWKLATSANAGALAIAGKTVVVPLIHTNQIAIVDTASGSTKTVKTGMAPFGAALNSEGTIAYVTNWAGRPPKPGDLTAPAGDRGAKDKIVTDARGIASSGTVERIDLATGTITNTINVGLHPTATVWHEGTSRLYVANGNQDSISVIDTKTNRIAATFPLQPFSREVKGIAPTALAISPDGKTLYAACGGINAIAVLNASTGKIRGMIPTAWYPESVSLTEGHLAIATLLGVGPGFRDEPKRKYVHADRGSVHVMSLPTDAELASFTTAVIANNRMKLPAADPKPRANAKAQPVPERAGEPSPIAYVVYVIKENRTYDQVLGDLGKGNGDPSLTMFGESVTPNQHKLAREFVTLDNFYAAGGNSADGHQWLTQANETDYCLWPGYAGRSYPFDGSDPIAISSGGFIWEAALRMKKSVQIFGEYAGVTRELPAKRQQFLKQWTEGADFTSTWNHQAPIAAINPILAKNFPGYTTNIPDVIRAQIFASHLKAWEASGTMPNLVLLQLPSNHTQGTNAGVSTAKAMVADNDYAVGLVVDALSHSKFWPKMQIFIIEDDAQNGVDHVDGHRMPAFAVGPYVKRGAIDSTFYSNPGLLKTIELILGLPTLSLFDLIAPDMRASFTEKPDLTPFTAEKPRHDLFELNPPLKALKRTARKNAAASAKMNWDEPDRAPAGKLNRIIWADVMGLNVKYPKLKRSVFAPMAADADEDDDDDKK